MNTLARKTLGLSLLGIFEKIFADLAVCGPLIFAGRTRGNYVFLREIRISRFFWLTMSRAMRQATRIWICDEKVTCSIRSLRRLFLVKGLLFFLL